MMNIKQAKEYIKNSVHIYLKKDEFSEYCIPVVRQRPIFLLGAPGIGKTAVMEQIAQEMGIGLVSYSMTHHTRQSALGLPFIAHKNYGGNEFDISEYTMSEIISSVYETMEESGIKEGILFLDEINCVSETLAPAMLQFLQYKVFGKHRVPEGWVIVTAGNPPEYNKSVREFDVVTLDRLKVMEIEPDYNVWKEYAMQKGIHSAVLSFLDLKKEHFYHMEMTTKGRSYVTARGWEDLSEILKQYEEDGITVDETLIGQYLRNDKIVKEFAAYYDLYNKYKKDYRIEELLEGNAFDSAITRAKEAPFDERLSLLGMLEDRILGEMKDVMEQAGVLTDTRTLLVAVKNFAAGDKSATQVAEFLTDLSLKKKQQLESSERAGALSKENRRKGKMVLRLLDEFHKEIMDSSTSEGQAAYELLADQYRQQVEKLKKDTGRTKERLHHVFDFIGKAMENGHEMLIFVTDLTVSSDGSGFIANFGSEDYQKYSSELMLGDRRDEILGQIKDLNL